jgi:predicted MFS family arabinose efflux permease
LNGIAIPDALFNRRAFGVLVAGFFTVSIAYSIRYGYGMLLPPMLAELGISKTQAGVIYSAYFFVYTLFSPVLGVLSDRYNLRVILTFFTVLLAAGAGLMALTTSVVSAALIFALAGLGHSACWAPVVALVQRWVPDRRRGAALAVATLGSAFGIAAWGFLLPMIVGIYGWRAGWTGLGIFGLCVAVLNYALVRNPVSSPGPVTTDRASSGRTMIPPTYWHLIRDHQLWWIGISYLFVGFTVLVPYTFLSVYATEGLAQPYSVATRLIAVIAIAGVVGKLVLGIASDAIGRIRMMILCNILLGSGCLGMACITDIIWIHCATIIFGFGFGAVWPVYAAAAPDFFDPRSAGSVIGLWTVFLGIGSIFSPVVCGWIIDHTGGYAWVFTMGALGSVLGIGFLLPAFHPIRRA